MAMITRTNKAAESLIVSRKQVVTAINTPLSITLNVIDARVDFTLLATGASPSANLKIFPLTGSTRQLSGSSNVPLPPATYNNFIFMDNVVPSTTGVVMHQNNLLPLVGMKWFYISDVSVQTNPRIYRLDLLITPMSSAKLTFYVSMNFYAV